jgi:hypothetical protein
MIDKNTILHGDWLKAVVNWTVQKPGKWSITKKLSTTIDFNGCTIGTLLEFLSKPSLSVILQRGREKGKDHCLALDGKTFPYTSISGGNQLVTPEALAEAVPEEDIDKLIAKLQERKKRTILRKAPQNQ